MRLSQNKSRSTKREQGFLASALVAVIGVLISSFISMMMYANYDAYTSLNDQAIMSDVDEKAINCIDSILPQQAWYYDSNILGTVTLDQNVVELCGLPTDRSVEYQISNLIYSQDVAYRELAYWLTRELPFGANPPTSFNRSTGVVTIADGTVGSSRSSFTSEKVRVKNATAQLERIVKMHTIRFDAMSKLSGDSGYNYFRAVFCYDAKDTEIPCSDSAVGGVNGWKNINEINNQAVFSASSLLSNPWGLAINYCNTNECGASVINPYNILFETRSPWGDVYVMVAMQNI